jgi:hypothetical protein
MESQTNMARWYFAIKYSKKCPEKKWEKNKEFLEAPIYHCDIHPA